MALLKPRGRLQKRKPVMDPFQFNHGALTGRAAMTNISHQLNCAVRASPALIGNKTNPPNSLCCL